MLDWLFDAIIIALPDKVLWGCLATTVAVAIIFFVVVRLW